MTQKTGKQIKVTCTCLEEWLFQYLVITWNQLEMSGLCVFVKPVYTKNINNHSLFAKS